MDHPTTALYAELDMWRDCFDDYGRPLLTETSLTIDTAGPVFFALLLDAAHDDRSTASTLRRSLNQVRATYRQLHPGVPEATTLSTFLGAAALGVLPR